MSMPKHTALSNIPGVASSIQSTASDPLLAAKPKFLPPGAQGRTTGEQSPGGKLTTEQFRKAAQSGTRNFEGCDLSGVRLCGLDLCTFKFDGSNLSGADLRVVQAVGASFVGANLTGADLHEANLTQASLGGCKFVNADLEGASLRFAEITGADFTGAKLERALRNPSDSPIQGWESSTGSLRKVTN